MKNECSIVGDLLPLYAESLLSKESVEFVSRHLKDCQACRTEYKKLSEPSIPIKDTNVAPLKLIKKKLLIKNVQAIILTATLVLALTISIFGFLTAPKYYPYSSNLLDINTVDNGVVIISFDEKITGYRMVQENAPIGEDQVYHIEAWTTVWDTLFWEHGQQYAVIEPEASVPVAIYYVQNYQNGTTTAEDVLIYGDSSISHGGVISLPDLSFEYLFISACALLIICSSALVILRKSKKVRLLLERIILFPLAYGIGHFCVLQFKMSSHSATRDFFLILLIAILVYCAMLFTLNIYYIKKEIKEVESLRR